jgi:hypothetical protein
LTHLWRLPLMQPTKPPVRRSVPPYNTGKVKIGLAYVPSQPWSPSRDAYNLQTALLSPARGRGPVSIRLFAFLKGFV